MMISMNHSHTTSMKDHYHLHLVLVSYNFNLEETTWFVVSNPIPISYTIVEYFKDALKPPTVIY